MLSLLLFQMIPSWSLFKKKSESNSSYIITSISLQYKVPGWGTVSQQTQSSLQINDDNADTRKTEVINEDRGQTYNLIINIKGAWGPVSVKQRQREGWRRRGGRLPTTHNALIYQKGEGVVHGRRPAGYRGGGRPICSAMGRGWSPRLTKPPTGQEGRCQSQAQSNSAK